MNKILLLAPLLLVGCFKTADKSDWMLYQPEVLIFEKGQVVQTVDGEYVIRNDREAWHSTKTVNDLEERLLRYSK